MAEFHKVKQDEVVYPIIPGPYKMACCDCGLVHNWYFEIVRVPDFSKPTSEDIVVNDPELRVRLTCERNNRSTAAMRREDAKKGDTKYARNLIELRDKIVASGQKLLSWDEINEEAKGRGGG